MTTDTNTCKAWTATDRNERVTVEITRKGIIIERYAQRGAGYYTRECETVAQGHQQLVSAIVWLASLDEPVADVALSYLAQLQNVSPRDTVADLFPVTLFNL